LPRNLTFLTTTRSVLCLLDPFAGGSQRLLELSALLAILLVLGGTILLVRKALFRRTATSSAPFPDWAADKPWESLKAIFIATLDQGNSAINWYRDNIRTKRLGSQLIRLLAIVLASIGALIPLIVAAARSYSDSRAIFDPQWGYFSFATAAVLLAVDKFYGFSTGWVRYIKTQLALERSLSDLRYDWTVLVSKIQNQTPTPDQVQLILQRLKDFVDFVHSQVQLETEAWILEFQSGLSDLMSSIKAQSDATRPGSVQVTITNASKFESVTALLDQVTELTIDGGQCLFPSVTPGVHTILARGKKAESLFTAGQVVKVTSGALATISIAIPIPS
jgi:hypothetical protein